MKSSLLRGVCVIGRGRWSASLVPALRAVGETVHVLPGRRSADSEVAGMRGIQVFWLCVPDAAMEETAVRLVKRLQKAGFALQGRIFLHSSGSLSSSVLQAAKRAGAGAASVHPLMSFPTRRRVSLAGVPFAVEAEGALRKKLMRLVKTLGGRPFAVASEGKALYHAAAVLASPLLVSLASAAEATAMLAGLSPRQTGEVLQPILVATLSNVLKDGAGKSFSGPFARGEAQTVSLHLAALKAHPHLQQVYRSLALHALDQLPVQNRAGLRRALRPLPGKPDDPEARLS